MESKLKQLEFIQNIISRMGQNSFLLKGWSVTLLAGLFALAAKDAEQKYIVIAYFPTIIFWLLDSYYLYQERIFRKLYNVKIKEENSDLSLDTSKVDSGFGGWASACFSVTIILFYGILAFTIYLVTNYIIK